MLNQFFQPCESKYDIGYNPHLGDSIFKILFKSNVEKHRMNKRHIFA